MNNNFFDTEGLENSIDDSSGIWGLLFSVLARGALALTTIGFFWMYVPDLMVWAVGHEFGPYASAAVGVVCLDVFAVLWNKMSREQNSTPTQLSFSGFMHMANVAVSFVISVIFFILITDFIPVTDAAGNLTDIGQSVNIAGLIVGAFGTAGNGAAIAWWEYNSRKAKQERDSAKVAGIRHAGQQKIEKARAVLEVIKTLQDIGQALPQLTTDQSRANAARWIQANYGVDADLNEDGQIDDKELMSTLGSLKLDGDALEALNGMLKDGRNGRNHPT